MSPVQIMSYVKYNLGPRVALRRELSVLNLEKHIEICSPGIQMERHSREKEQYPQRPRGDQAQS